MDNMLWEDNIDVAATGSRNSTLRMTGGMFAANRAIAQMQRDIQETLTMLRFKRAMYEWYRGSEYTYYDLSSLDDGVLAEASGAGWTEISTTEPRVPIDISARELRAQKLDFLQRTPATRWRVRIPVTVCPSASDWYPASEALQRAIANNRTDFDLPHLPQHCWRIERGDTVRLPPAGSRNIDTHADHILFQARTEDGRVFWTDEIDSVSMEPLD
jgi:hypothetical protein